MIVSIIYFSEPIPFPYSSFASVFVISLIMFDRLPYLVFDYTNHARFLLGQFLLYQFASLSLFQETFSYSSIQIVILLFLHFYLYKPRCIYVTTCEINTVFFLSLTHRSLALSLSKTLILLKISS